GADACGHAWGQYALGWSLLCWERFDAARSELTVALATFDSSGIALGALRCQFALAVADVLQFSQADRAPELDSLARGFDDAGFPLEAMRCRLYRAVLFNILGRPHDAQTVLAQLDNTSLMAG